MPVVVTRSIVALLLVVMVVVFAAPVAAQPRVGSVVYTPPVDAPIGDPFRPPSTPYGPGNRGIEYATPAGVAGGAAGARTPSLSRVASPRRALPIRPPGR